MGHVYIQKLFVVYLKFELNWVVCIFICSIWQPYPWASPPHTSYAQPAPSLPFLLGALSGVGSVCMSASNWPPGAS